MCIVEKVKKINALNFGCGHALWNKPKYKLSHLEWSTILFVFTCKCSGMHTLEYIHIYDLSEVTWFGLCAVLILRMLDLDMRPYCSPCHAGI